MARILFILKHREQPYSDECGYRTDQLSSGLFNSARFVERMLADVLDHETHIAHAIDNNCIDRLVSSFRPDIVVIEAYWVVPEKFEVLIALHPAVTWVVRNHSALPFAAQEGQIVDWSLRYMDYANVVLACNDERADKQFRKLIAIDKPGWTTALSTRCVWLPNFYPATSNFRVYKNHPDFWNIGCFGAVRPMKNHLMQAAAAMEFAQKTGKTLRFHINGTRVEGRGEPVLHNLRNLFKLLPHELIEHPWLPHDLFIDLVRAMDIGVQVSFTETFNIVTADMITNGVPVVVSPEIAWVHDQLHADPNDSDSIVEALTKAARENHHRHALYQSLAGLTSYNDNSIQRWDQFIRRTMDCHAARGIVKPRHRRV